MCLQSFQLICDILLTHKFQKQLLCLSKQLKCWLIKSIFYDINNRIKSVIINWFVMFIQIFWMCCRCCLWVSCDLMQYWIISLSSLSWKCWWWYCLYFAIWHFYFLYSKLKLYSFSMFSSVWKVRSASSFPQRAACFLVVKFWRGCFWLHTNFGINSGQNKAWTISLGFTAPNSWFCVKIKILF